MAVARNVWGFIERRDHRLMRRLNRWRAPRWIVIGCSPPPASVTLDLVFHRDPSSTLRGPQRFAAVSSAALAASSASLSSKRSSVSASVHALARSNRTAGPKVLPPDKFSFPSGHTMTASSVALVLTYFYPSLEIALVFLALSIALSRIVLGMHFLSDVLAGIVLGVALGCCALTTYASSASSSLLTTINNNFVRPVVAVLQFLYSLR